MDLEKLKDELRRDEGLRLTPYRCTAGALTIGYGHNLEAHGPAGLPRFLAITIDRAEKWLDEDIMDAVACVHDWLPSDIVELLSDVRMRVVVNMAFCLGTRLWQFKRLRSCIMAMDWKGAAMEMLESRWASQVGDRAIRLALMMREG